jgi:hypothetical protein
LAPLPISLPEPLISSGPKQASHEITHRAKRKNAAPLHRCAAVQPGTTLTLPLSYYDLTNSLCGDNDPFVTNWAESSGINNGVPYCEGSTDKSLADLGTNRIVAVNATMMQGDPSEWCGKE